ncbi:hypothetical protein D3C86_1474150 [compost metagenome]
MFSLATSHEAFDAQGQLKDAANRQRLEGMLDSYLAMARSLVAGSKTKQIGV